MAKSTIKYKDKTYVYENIGTRHIKDPQRQEAIKNVVNDIIDGATNSVLLQKLQEDCYDIGRKYSSSNAQKIVIEARAILKEDFDKSIKNARETLWNCTMDIYTEAKQMGDFSDALKALQYVGKLSGLDDVHKIDMTLKGDIEINFGLGDED